MKSRWPITHILEITTYSRAGEVIDKNYWGKGSEILYTCAKDPVRSDFPNFPNEKRTTNGDLLLARNGYGYAYFPNPGSIYTNVVQRVQIDRKRANPKYIWHVLNSKLGQLRGVGQGIPSLNMSVWNALDIPLPPLSVQEEIISTLEAVNNLKNGRERADKKMATFAPALFLELFGDPRKNERGWEVKKLGAIANLTSGGTPDRKHHEYYGGTIPWVKSGELHEPIIKGTEEMITMEGLKNSSAKLQPVGTVLIAMYGATVGAISELGIEASTNQAICCVSPNQDSLVREYFIQALKMRTAELLALRAGGAQPNLSQEKIKQLDIPVPPLQLQRRFATHIASACMIQTMQRKSREEQEEIAEGVVCELI